MNPCAKRRIENKCMYEPISEKCFACKYFINKSQTVIVAHFFARCRKIFFKFYCEHSTVHWQPNRLVPTLFESSFVSEKAGRSQHSAETQSMFLIFALKYQVFELHCYK